MEFRLKNDIKYISGTLGGGSSEKWEDKRRG
jgi:hypothetical protein